MTANRSVNAALMKQSRLNIVKKDFRLNWSLYLLVLPVLAFYIIFCYKPMYGIIIAFENYSPAMGFAKSPWVGLTHFKNFFGSYFFWRLIRNTLVISFANLIFAFPSSIILALMMNEVRCLALKKSIQTITYMPHFVSMVVVCGLIVQFTKDTGFINDIIAFFGGERVSLLTKPEWFVPIYTVSGIWQGVGWGSIIYMSAIAGIDQEQYEAARIDGAGRFAQIFYITLPSIMPTIVIMLILQIGSMMNVGYEKIILLQNSLNMETSDIISSYVYRAGLQDFNWSFSTAVGLFNSVTNVILLVTANQISKKVNDTSLW